MHFRAQNHLNGVHYTNLEENGIKYVTGKTTAKGIHWSCAGSGCFLGKEGNGAEVKGSNVAKCWEDKGTELTGTEKTTPTASATTEGARVSCWYE
jgi:hypothetical protein